MGTVVPLRFGIDGRFVRREFFELLRIGESGADQVDVEAAFDVPHGDAESRAEIGGGADGFGAGVFVRKGVLRRESRRWARSPVGSAVWDRVTRSSKVRRAGFSVLGAEVLGKVWDSRWMIAESWALAGIEKKRRRRERITQRRGGR